MSAGEREYWREMPDEEAVARIRRELGVDEFQARFILSLERGETTGDAFINRHEENRA